MKYHHLGIPTQAPREGEVYLAEFDAYCTDHESNTFGIQWMRYGKKCRLPKIVREVAHAAFQVENLAEALEGKEVIIPQLLMAADPRPIIFHEYFQRGERPGRN